MPPKYSLERVQEIFQENGCELITKEYKHNKQVLEFKCKCNKFVHMSFKKYLTDFCCEECHKKTLKRVFRYSHTEVKEIFKIRNCELLSSEYVNNRQKLDYICECKNQAIITLHEFLDDGQRCQKCAIRKRKETNLIIYGNECSMNSDLLKPIWIDKIKNRTNEEKQSILEKRKVTVLNILYRTKLLEIRVLCQT
jgi:hypothetical protein